MRTGLALSLLITWAAVAQASEQKGTLCIAGMPCFAAAGRVEDVAPVDTERLFTWSDAPGKTTIGVIPAGARRLSLTPPRAIRLRLKSMSPERWPARTALSIRDQQKHSWQLVLSPKEARSSFEIDVPDGEYDVEVAADRHRREIRHVRSAASAEVSIALKPLPQITGRVVSKAGDSVAGAELRVNQRTVAVSDARGRFAFDADPDAWPETVSIGAGGYGTRTVPIPRSRIDTDLLDVSLSAGGFLQVIVVRSPEIGALRLDVYKLDDGRRGAAAYSRSLGSNQMESTFEDVDAGDYLVLASGDKPEERCGVKIAVKSAEKNAVKLSVRPHKLTLRADLRGAPLGSARIRFWSRDGLWNADFTSAENGELQLYPWQLGKASAWVYKEGAMTVPHMEDRRFDEDDGEADWTIHVSTRETRGRVIDAVTGEPIAGANVALEVKGPSPYSTLTKSGSDGRFVFTTARPGQHTIHAAADGYQNGHARYQFLDSEESHEVTLALEPAGAVRVIVRDASDRPLRDAAVLDYSSGTLTGQRFTDENGQVVIPLGRDELRQAFVIPRDGSFAIATIGSQPEAVIVVPPPQSTILIRSRSTDQNPIDHVMFIIRFNGIAIPFGVQGMLARQQGATIVSGSDGRIVLPHVPLGLYEFWPVGSPAEAQAAMQGLGKEAPITISAAPGVNEAVLSFASPKRP